MNRRIIIDIVHPADVLFFHHPIRLLRQANVDVFIASREKDKTTELLTELGHTHRCISTAGRGLAGLAFELCERDWNLLQLARQIKPDLLCGFGAVAPAHVGSLLRIPAVSFYDSENAKLQQRISVPLIDRLYVPDSYAGKVPERRTRRFPGIKELSYFHPSNFSVDTDRALRAGLVPETRNFFVRQVAWNANHDARGDGWAEYHLRHLVGRLSTVGKVHISSERGLPSDLRAYCVVGSVTDLHHLLACCDLYIGESATMAAEAVILGVPAIYQADVRPAYTAFLAQLGILYPMPLGEFKQLAETLDDLLDTLEYIDRSSYRNWLNNSENLALYVCQQVLDCLDILCR